MGCVNVRIRLERAHRRCVRKHSAVIGSGELGKLTRSYSSGESLAGDGMGPPNSEARPAPGSTNLYQARNMYKYVTRADLGLIKHAVSGESPFLETR